MKKIGALAAAAAEGVAGALSARRRAESGESAIRHGGACWRSSS